MQQKIPFPPPRYSYYSWIVWGISVLFVFYKYMLEVSPSIIVHKLMSDFHASAGALGHIAASYYYAYMIMQIPAGLLIDTYGPKKMATMGLLVCSSGALLFGMSSHIFIAGVSRFLIGIGASFAVLNTLKLTANWFPAKKFSLLIGLMMTLGTLGAVLGQGPLSYFINLLGSWRNAINCLVVIGFILTLFFYLIVRDRPKFIVHEENFQVPKPKKVPIKTALISILKKPQTWILSIYSGLAFAPVTTFGGLWGINFLETKYHFDHTTASYLTSTVFIGFAIGAPVFGWFSNLLGRRKPIMMIGTIVSFLLLSLLLYSPSLSSTATATLLLLFGFSISSFLLSFTVIHEINIPIVTATAIGIMNTFNGFFGAVTDPLVGIFLDLGWDKQMFQGAPLFSAQNYLVSLSVLPLYLFLSLGLLYFVKETHCKQVTEETEVT